MFRLLASLAFAFAPSLAAAQEGPISFAAAQAAEAAIGYCWGVDAGAIECAQNECMEQTGFGVEDCAANLYCFPAFWTADIFMQHQEGPHWHRFLCGYSSREEIEQVAQVLCSADWLIDCALVRIWDPDGEEVFTFGE